MDNSKVRFAKAMGVNLNNCIMYLNQINDKYPRHQGSMIMVSDDTENQIEGLCRQIQSLVRDIKKLPVEVIGEIAEGMTAQQYTDWLDKVVEPIIRNNLMEVARARDFLRKYHSC